MSPAAPTSDDRRPSERPLVELLAIAAPTVATMTSYTLMTFIDGLMVSRIGPEPVYVAAQGNGNIAAFVPISIVMGLVGVVNTYVSQNLGAGRPERGAAYAWNGLWICAMASLLLVPYALAIPSLYALAGHEPALLAMETQYARILVLGAFLTMATRSIAQYFYGMHRPMIVLLAALAGNLTNVFFNTLFIFGEAGATPGMRNIAGAWAEPAVGAVCDAAAAVAGALRIPALGVHGAAWGTLVGSAVELAIPLLVFVGPRFNRKFATRAAWRPSLPHLRDIARLGWAPALMFGNEIACWSIFVVALVGGFGTDHNAAGWIALRFMHLSFMPAVGISNAVTALVGKCMGMKRPDLAARRAHLGLAVTMVYMGLCALAFVLFAGPMFHLFMDEGMPPEQHAAILKIGMQVMVVAAIFQLFDAMGITMIGALRGAGDTVWPGVVTIILSWTFIVGLGGLLAWSRPDLGSLGPWIGAGTYIVVLGLFLITRFLRGRWKTIDLLARTGMVPPGAVDPSALGPPTEPVPGAPAGG